MEEEATAGCPAWMATFADLMSLLMCFFVLLLSFSEMDAQKYKLVAGSMKNAFGVQQETIAMESPNGRDAEVKDVFDESASTPEESTEAARDAMLKELQELLSQTEEDIEKIEDSMQQEIGNGFIELESGFRTITIRIKEKGSFSSGSADLQQEFVPVMTKLQNVLSGMEGQISVEGHTDDIDINTARFSSNWELSSARALSVGHELIKNDIIESERFVISGYADTVPFTENDTATGRASNRRVEIVIRQPVSQEVTAGLQALDENDPALRDLLDGTDVNEVRPQ